MNKVVLITGDLAAGKSTLADNLSNALNIVCVKKDNVKEVICDSVGFNTREENRRISVAAVNSMILFLEQIGLMEYMLIPIIIIILIVVIQLLLIILIKIILRLVGYKN